MDWDWLAPYLSWEYAYVPSRNRCGDMNPLVGDVPRYCQRIAGHHPPHAWGEKARGELWW